MKKNQNTALNLTLFLGAFILGNDGMAQAYPIKSIRMVHSFQAGGITDVLARAQGAWTCEVHGIWGEQDALYADTLAQVPKVLHRMSSFKCVAGAGHWVQYEAPDAFHACLDKLI